jgi:hypothetical protein
VSNRVPDKGTLLAAAAKRAANDPMFMAFLLATHRRGAFNLAEIATEFGTNEASVVTLALCRRPRQSPELFAKDVYAIAAHSGIPPERIAAVVRRADALAAMRSGESAQMMAAAQDEINPPPAGPPDKP